MAIVGLALLLSPIANAAVPDTFGNDHDDPRTAYPTVPRPATPACSIEIVDHAFDSFEPARGTIDAAKSCPGPWQRIVLEYDGEVKGRQYDRIGHLAIGGVTVFRTSSPEPSREGIAWHVEKDITAYAPLFGQAQPLEMHLGNVVNETYTGVFRIRARIVFYRADASHPAAATADIVAPLDELHADGADTLGTFTLPANAERLVAEVYATGSGGGCEEFWYFALPEDAVGHEGYWCKAPQGPYREVQVLVDGRIAGIAAPFPHVYTGGWSNPFLWYAIPAPRAFDIHPIRFELTPFIGEINDGKPHELRLRVLGVPAPGTDGEGKGWALHPNVQVWRDAGSKATRGALLDTSLGELELAHPVAVDAAGNGVLRLRAHHAFSARGYLQTSHGRVETEVERRLDNTGRHHWGKQEDADDHLRSEWADRETIRRTVDAAAPETRDIERRFGIDGAIVTRPAGEDAQRLTTTIVIHDDIDRLVQREGRDIDWHLSRDRYEGSASYAQGVPREQRHAVGESRQTVWKRDADGGCYRRTIATRNGYFVADDGGCPGSTSP